MRWRVVLLAVALTAAACSAEDSVLRAVPGGGQSTATTGPAGGDPGIYPPEIVEAYLDGCVSGSGDAEVCRCTLDEFQDRLTLEEFLAIEDLQSGVVLDVASACMEQIGMDTTPSSVPLPPSDLRAYTDLTLEAVEAYWEDELPAVYGLPYETVQAAIPYFPSSGDLPGCGPDPLPAGIYSDNAFYCRPGDFVAWDAEGLMPGLYTEFGDFAVALVLAHEWGHVVQDRAGTTGLGIMLELQADCFAGAWAGHIAAGESGLLALQPGDLDEAVAGYLLFRDPPGTSPTEPDAHGSAFDRVLAFQDGFFDGAAACAAYPDGAFTVVDIPLTREDLVTGGDLPFADTAPLLIATLESFWTAVYPQVFGADYVPMTAYGPYLPSTGMFPPCGDAAPEDYPGNAFYCPDGDYVAWDNEGLFPALWQEVGDLAVGMVLAHEWANAVQSRAGLPSSGDRAELQADCFSGAWSGALAGGIPITLDDGSETFIALSAGDLDEAVAGFLLFSEGAGPVSNSAFARFDAFQRGFLSGPGECLAFSE